jgi:hypothetical protein
MQQRIISDPHGYGLMVINDPYVPSDFEFAVRGDYPQTAEQIFEEIGKGLCLMSFPLSAAFVLAGGYILTLLA